MAHAEFVGNHDGALPQWSDPSEWANGQVPKSSNGLHVTVDVTNSMVTDHFVTNNVIAANLGLNLFIGSGAFLSVHDLEGFATLAFFPNGVLDVRHDAGDTAFGDVLSSHGTLILDHPPHGSLDNSLSVARSHYGVSQLNLELGGVQFDGVYQSQNSGGGTTLHLTEHGSPVYELTNVHLGAKGSATVAGPDPQTGYDILTLRG